MIRAILTIDDVASRNTPAIVDYLCRRGIRAILFALGECAERFSEQAVYAVKRGMILGNHSWSHPAFSALPMAECAREIERCEALLDRLYRQAGVERRFRPFRFPFGDKGGAHRAALQAYLAENGFDKLRDTRLDWPWWRESGLDRDIDTFWTFDFKEYRIRPGSGFDFEDVLRRIHDPNPAEGAPLLAEGGSHILLMHASDETEEALPEYYRRIVDHLLENGVVFDEPEFLSPRSGPGPT